MLIGWELVGNPGTLIPVVLRVSPWDLNLEGHSLYSVWSLQTGHGAGNNSAWDAFLHSNNEAHPLSLGPFGWFLRLFRAGLTAIVGASVFCLVLFSSYFPPRILYHNIRSEPVATRLSKADWRSFSVFIIMADIWNDWELYHLRSFSLCNLEINNSKLAETLTGLSGNLPGLSLSPCSMSPCSFCPCPLFYVNHLSICQS